MGTLSLVSEYLKDLEECIYDGDSRVSKEEKLFDALEHKSVVTEVDNQKITIFTKAPLRAFGEPFIRYSLPCKVDGQGAWYAELDLADSANYVTKKVLENIGFVHVSLSDYDMKMVNDVIVEIDGVKFKDDFVVLDYVNKEEPSILFGRDFLATTKSQVDFGLGEIRMNLTKLEEIPPISTIPPQPIYHPLTAKQKEKMKEVLDIKYKELEESTPILEVLENYVIYKKKLDEILIGKERLNKKEFSEEDKVGIIEHVLPKKMCDPENYVLQVKINGVFGMVALVDTGASAMGEVKNVRIQIGYQAYVVDLLIPDIPVDPELPLLLGRPFLRTWGAIIDMGRGTLCINDGVIRHTYFPKPRSKSYVEAFEMEGEDDWLGSFKVGRDEDGNVKYGSVAPLFIDIEDDMERALAIEAYFNPFKNKVDGDEDWHARFEIVTPSGRKFNQAFKTKTTTRKLSGKFKTKDDLRHAYCEKLSKLQEMSIGVPRVANWRFCDGYGFEDTLREMMKLEYIYEGDGDVFFYYSWERALSTDNEIYPEWVLEFFSTLYFHKDVDRNNFMKEKCIWFRLCRHEHILTLLEFAVVLAWIIADNLYKHTLGTKENNVICAGHYVTKIACFLGYCMDDEIKKHSEPIDCEYWTSKMLADELDVENTCLNKKTEMPTQAEEGSREPWQDHGGLNSSWGDWNANLSMIERGNLERLYVDAELLYARTFHAHSPSFCRPSNQGESYGLGGDDYVTSAMPDFGGRSSGYAVGGLSREAGFNDDSIMDE
nr:hypothetical protein [Tanacetum cinerariifolium]